MEQLIRREAQRGSQPENAGDGARYSSKYVEMWALLNSLPTTPEQDAACLFLEGKGMTFCVHYGYENAIEKAQQYREWTTPGRA